MLFKFTNQLTTTTKTKINNNINLEQTAMVLLLKQNCLSPMLNTLQNTILCSLVVLKLKGFENKYSRTRVLFFALFHRVYQSVTFSTQHIK